MFQKLLGLIKTKALMIKINVITNNNNGTLYKKSQNYIDRKINKLNLKKKFLKKIFIALTTFRIIRKLKILIKNLEKKINQQTFYLFLFNKKRT